MHRISVIFSVMMYFDSNGSQLWGMGTTVELDWSPQQHPPSKPSKPSLVQTSGLVYTENYCTTHAFDSDDTISYEFNWGDGTTPSTTEYVDSGLTVGRQHTYTRPGTYSITAKAKDYSGSWGSRSDPLVVQISQNDVGWGIDAGNGYWSPTVVSNNQWFTSTLYASNPSDKYDWYSFDIPSGMCLNVQMTPPHGVDFDIFLYDPYTYQNDWSWRACSINGGDVMDHIFFTTDMAGYWRVKVEIYSNSTFNGGEGQYQFGISWWTPGGGGGCPYLYVYNGTGYRYEGLLPIHDSNGTDIVANRTLSPLLHSEYGTYRFRLEEHPKTCSYIDQMKLYAILENKAVVQLPLVWAWHSEDGFVLPQLMFSDEWKTETKGADHNNGTSQSINLRFLALPPGVAVKAFVFQIEGNNPYTK